MHPKIRTKLLYQGEVFAQRRKSSIGTTIDWIAQQLENYSWVNQVPAVACVSIILNDWESEMEIEATNRFGTNLPYDVQTETF